MNHPFINIKEGKMTYGQRIDLGTILGSNDKTESQIFVESLKCLYGKEPKPKDFLKLMPQYAAILEGIVFWIDQEKTLLKYTPSPEEMRAGLSELSEKIGEFGTIKALAAKYNKDPDEILGWEYAKVFGILYTDLEEAKYQKRYNDIVSKK